MARKRATASKQHVHAPESDVDAPQEVLPHDVLVSVSYVRLAELHPSPDQTRPVVHDESLEELAASIERRGLHHLPIVRPHPTHGYYIVVGHRRVAALQRLAETGRGRKVLVSADVGLLVPVFIQELDDNAALGNTVDENLLRVDLRPWQEVLAIRKLHDQGRGTSSQSIRSLSDTLKMSKSAMQRLLAVARGLSPDPFWDAGLLPRDTEDLGQADAGALNPLSFAALQRVVEAGPDAADVLRDEIARALPPNVEPTSDPHAASAEEQAAAAIPRRPRESATRVTRAGFRLSIRSPLDELEPAKAARHLADLAPVVAVLSERAVGALSPAAARELMSSLEHVQAVLRQITSQDL